MKRNLRNRIVSLSGFAVLLAFALFGVLGLRESPEISRPSAVISTAPLGNGKSHADRAGMVAVPAGRFEMGSEVTGASDALPVHMVYVDAFYLDTRPVTNRQFAEFIAATHYVTTAEQIGRSNVFDPAAGEWKEIAGAYWRKPDGPNSSIVGRDDYPVVQVSWRDAAAYANWAGKRLPTEAEYEYAARAGRTDARFPWGPEEFLDDQHQANYWQGRFPHEDLGHDGRRGLAPVESFRPNALGLYGMAGNAWCWCADWYDSDYYLRAPRRNPAGPNSGDARVLRGGSWLSAKNHLFGIQTACRWRAAPSRASNDIGFRCAAD